MHRTHEMITRHSLDKVKRSAGQEGKMAAKRRVKRDEEDESTLTTPADV